MNKRNKSSCSKQKNFNKNQQQSIIFRVAIKNKNNNYKVVQGQKKEIKINNKNIKKNRRKKENNSNNNNNNIKKMKMIIQRHMMMSKVVIYKIDICLIKCLTMKKWYKQGLMLKVNLKVYQNKKIINFE